MLKYAVTNLIIGLLLCANAFAATVHDDSFGRSETNSWGTPETTGSAYNDLQSTWLDVDGSEGNMTPQSGGQETAVVETGDDFTDMEATLLVTPGGYNYRHQFHVRYTDNSNHYEFRIDRFGNDQIVTEVAGGRTELANAAGGAFSSGVQYDMRFRVEDSGSDSLLKVKWWTGSEGGWEIEATDTTTDHASGSVAFGSNAGAGGNTTDFDDFVIDDLAGAGGGVIKTLNGLAWASVKTVNGLAVGSVKTINGAAAQ